MSLIKQIGYIAFEVSDLNIWEKFSTKVLGLVKSETTKDGFNLRIDQYQRRFFIEKGKADDVTAIGFEVEDEEALNNLQAQLNAADFEGVQGTPQEIKNRGVTNLIKYCDPSGVPLEFYYGAVLAETSFKSDLVEDGFVADQLGFGHVVVSCHNHQASQKFYLDTLGFKLSDTMHLKFGPKEFKITFTHVNKRHHSLAFSVPMPKKIHHFLVQCKNMDDVGLAYDRAIDMGLRITQQLGRHTNDNMFSFYAQTPSGFEFEFGADALEIDDKVWQPKEYNSGSVWGHRPPPKPVISQPTAPSKKLMPEGNFLSLKDGYRLHYHDQGKGHAVIFLHGSGQGASGWSNFKTNAPAFQKEGYRTIIPDLIGFGYSSKPEDIKYSLEFHLDSLKQLIDHLQLDKVTLVGNSLGGALSIKYALSFPDKVEKLILLAPGGIEPQDVYRRMPGLHAMFKVVLSESPMVPDDLKDILRLQLYDQTLLSDEILEERFQVAQTQPKSVWTTMQVPFMGDQIKNLQCPILLFWGEDDKFLPVSGAKVVKEQCPQSTNIILPECGHWVMAEHTKTFNQKSLDFLS